MNSLTGPRNNNAGHGKKFVLYLGNSKHTANWQGRNNAHDKRSNTEFASRDIP